jgi:hypothetical protein
METTPTTPSAHTPGPWDLLDGTSAGTSSGQLIVKKDESRFHVLAHVYEDTAAPGHCTADARLIGAAPELLAVCKEWLAQDSCVCDEPELTEGSCLHCRTAAVTKAEGR